MVHSSDALLAALGWASHPLANAWQHVADTPLVARSARIDERRRNVVGALLVIDEPLLRLKHVPTLRRSAAAERQLVPCVC